ncbi:hypothetical protein KGF57_004572 [Candida theae]|uniref:Uncharacterized protein n=1 Tax=Candida theae TaxID=1198502 RepID=A0AAD5BBD8_9ASCO|nr:uncharacterized protein KGF57_004572 [Candida theae]KAI5949749.1 hypothetical protein KGF57_004572 [Candida theae]
MDEGITNLSQRVAKLQLALSNVQDDSIISQMTMVKSRVRDLREKHPELKTLFSLADRFPVQKPSRTEEASIPDSVKEEDLSLHYDAIMGMRRDMIEVVNINADSVINDISTRITQTRLSELTQTNASHNVQIKELYRYYTMLVVKSMIVSEKYVQYALDLNEFWLRMDQRLMKVRHTIEKKERQIQELNKY